jgi:hypothetical protein
MSNSVKNVLKKQIVKKTKIAILPMLIKGKKINPYLPLTCVRYRFFFECDKPFDANSTK